MTARSAAMGGAEWIERMRGRDVLQVAEALGFTTDGHKQTPGAWTISCPACGDEKRHHRSEPKGARGRGAVGIPKRTPTAWCCHQCGEKGDALTFIAHAVDGGRLGPRAREWCESWLGLSNIASTPRSPAAHPVRLVTQTPPRPPRYPQLEEVNALWSACKRVDEVPEVASWLSSKRIDPVAVADADLCRALPAGVHLPRWARFALDSGGYSDWRDSGYLLVAQMVDQHGDVRSVLARSVRVDQHPKSRAAAGFERRGLVLACPLARQVLAAGARPSWWPENMPLRFEIAEGEKRWAMRATLEDRRDREFAPACIGIESGSWTDELAARIPDGSSVFVATDPNDAGARYATTIIRSLAARIATGDVCVELHPHLELLETAGRPTVRVSP